MNTGSHDEVRTFIRGKLLSNLDHVSLIKSVDHFVGYVRIPLSFASLLYGRYIVSPESSQGKENAAPLEKFHLEKNRLYRLVAQV